jgi:hypothetical protein
MSKKHHESLNQTQSQDEVAVFLDRVLQWLCNLQSRGVETFEEERITELGQAIARKFGVVVFCDLNRNYRNAHNFRILMDGKGKAPLMPKERDYYAALKASQFEVRVDISRKGGFFCLRPYTISRIGNASSCVPVQEKSKHLLKICDQVVRFLAENELIQVPDALLDRPIRGLNELGGEMTVMTQLFGEI